MYKCLYLGIDAPPGVFHYPVIRTERIDSSFISQALCAWDEYTHLIFTSKRAVLHWEEVGHFANKEIIAIGTGTAHLLEKKGLFPLIAPFATQEGIIALIEEIGQSTDPFFLYPHSLQARPLLAKYLQEKKLRHCEFALYHTVPQKLEPIPNPLDFDEIVFTSPSTVDAFLTIFGSLPIGPKIKAIGPITQNYITISK